MVDFKLADYTMKTDCDLTRVVLLTSSREELHTCSTCRATLLVPSGRKPVCPVQRLLAWQRSRAANDAAMAGDEAKR